MPSGLLGAPAMKALIAEDKICGEVDKPDIVIEEEGEKEVAVVVVER